MRNMSTSHTSDTTSLEWLLCEKSPKMPRLILPGSVGPHSFIRNKWQAFRLRFEEEVAGEFGKERQLLTEAVIKAFQNGGSSSPFLKAFITASVRCCRSFSGNPQDFFTHSLHCCEQVSSLWFPGHSLQVQKLRRQSGL